jgi:acetate kinase
MTAAAISDLLYQSSGLLGVSGFSDDMKTLLASDKAPAAEAVDLFVYRICRELGSLAAALGGFDALVFTAGIGEHAPEIRRRVCEKAGWLGLEIDAAANAAGRPRITKGDSKNIRLDDPDGRRSDDCAPHLAARRRKQRTQRLTDKLRPARAGRPV